MIKNYFSIYSFYFSLLSVSIRFLTTFVCSLKENKNKINKDAIAIQLILFRTNVSMQLICFNPYAINKSSITFVIERNILLISLNTVNFASFFSAFINSSCSVSLMKWIYFKIFFSTNELNRLFTIPTKYTIITFSAAENEIKSYPTQYFSNTHNTLPGII